MKQITGLTSTDVELLDVLVSRELEQRHLLHVLGDERSQLEPIRRLSRIKVRIGAATDENP